MVDSFCGLIGNREACRVGGFGFDISCKNFPANYSLILRTAKLFHLERYAMYGFTFQKQLYSVIYLH